MAADREPIEGLVRERVVPRPAADVDDPARERPETTDARSPGRPPRARSFEDFYAAEAAAVHRAVAASLPDPGRAADAVDEAMARAYASWSRVGRYDAPAGWVYRVAMNWATSRWRKHRREASLVEREAEQIEARPAPSPVGSPALDALRALPAEQREVVACRVLLDLDTRTTAAALGIAEGTVKSRLSRALDALRTDLEAP
ncbi:MAG: sigma-70 family RNA polymerase sigma factor [Acidimicrobiales bacterium]